MLLRTAIHPTAVAKKYHSLKKRRIAQNWISYTILLGVLLLLATLAGLSCQPNCSWNARFTVFDFIRWRDDFSEEKKNLFSFSASTVTILSRLNIFLLKECCWAVHCSGQTNFLFIFTVLEIQTHKYVLPHILSIWEKVEECYHMSFSDRCCSITIHFDFYVTSKGQRSPINVCYVGICLKSCNFQDFWQDFHHIQL